MTMISATHLNPSHAPARISGLFAKAAAAAAGWTARRRLSHQLGIVRSYPPHLLTDVGLPGFEALTPEEQEKRYAEAVRQSRLSF